MSAFEIDRILPGYGRFRLSTGAKTAGEHRVRLALAEQLFRAGEVDTLLALRDGRLTWPDVLKAQRDGRLLHVTERLVLRTPFLQAAKQVFSADRVTEAKYLGVLGRLAKELGEQTTIESLRGVDWTAKAKAWRLSGAEWNHRRRAVSRLCSKVTTKGHPFWLELRDRWPKKAERNRVPIIEPGQFKAVLDRLPGDVAAFVRTLVLVGLRPTEGLRLAPGLLNGYRLTVPASKVERQFPTVAIDPRVLPIVAAACAQRPSYDRVRSTLKDATAAVGLERLSHRDCRHLAAQFMSKALVDPGAISGCLGHAVVNNAWQTLRYRLSPFGPAEAAQYTDWLIGQGLVVVDHAVTPIRSLRPA